MSAARDPDQHDDTPAGRRKSISKRYLKSKPVYEVTFRIDPEAAGASEEEARLAGDFNDWNPDATPMKRLKSGGFSATLRAPLLTERELEVLRLLPTGLTTREIGDELLLSRNTIKTYLRRVYRKLNASSRDETVARGAQLGLTSAEERSASPVERSSPT